MIPREQFLSETFIEALEIAEEAMKLMTEAECIAAITVSAESGNAIAATLHVALLD